MVLSEANSEGKKGGMLSIDGSVIRTLIADYGPVDLRNVESVDEIEELVTRAVKKGGVILASGGPHHAYFGRAGRGVSIGYEDNDGPKKEGPVHIHNPIETLIAENVPWIKQNIPDDLVTAINNYVNNGHEFGNNHSWDRSVVLLWEKPGRFMIMDAGTQYFNVVGRNTAEKVRTDIDWNDCPTLGRDFLGNFDHHNYFAIMQGQQKVGTMLYLLTGNAEPHPQIAKIEARHQ